MGYFDQFDFTVNTPGSKTYQGVPKTYQPTPVPTPVKPAPILAPKAPTIKERAFNIGEKVMDALAIPSQLTEKFLTQGKGYEQVLKERGASPATQKILGFGGKVVLDPINFIPVAKIPKVAKFLERVPGVAKVAEAFGDVGRTAGKFIDDTSILKKAKDTAGKLFVEGYDVSKQNKFAVDEIKDISRKYALAAEPKVEELRGIYNGIKKPEAETLAKFLDATPLRKGQAISNDLVDLINQVGQEQYDTFYKPLVEKSQNIFKKELDDLVARKRITPEMRREWIDRGGYYPHSDFTPESVDKFLKSTGVGEKRGYLKARKGVEGYSLNAPEVIAKREFSQLYDNAVQDTLKNIKETGLKNGSFVKIGKGKNVPEGFVPFIEKGGKYAEFKGYAVQKDIADYVRGNLEVGGKNPIYKAIDFFNSWWKPTATSFNPAFHVQNAIGNTSNIILGGTYNPKRLAQSVFGGFSPEEQKIVKESGILSKGVFSADIYDKSLADLSLDEFTKAKNTIGRLKGFGESIENNARSAFYLDQRAKFLRQGLDEVTAGKKAVKQVNKYLFDYQNGLTKFEKTHIKRIFPFYTWARFNLPLQLESIVTQPHKYAFLSKLDKELNPEGDPEGDQPGITVPLPFNDSEGNQVRWRPGLPVQDIFNLNPADRMINMLNPFIKEPALLGAYATRFTDTYRDPFTGKNVTNKNLPIDIQTKDIIKNRTSALLRPVRTAQKLGESDYSPLGIARQIIGGTYTIDPDSVELGKMYNQRSKQDAVENYIRTIIKDNSLTIDEKNQKIREFRQRMQQ